MQEVFKDNNDMLAMINARLAPYEQFHSYEQYRKWIKKMINKYGLLPNNSGNASLPEQQMTFTLKEVVAATGIHKERIRQMIDAGDLPTRKVSDMRNAHYYFTTDDVNTIKHFKDNYIPLHSVLNTVGMSKEQGTMLITTGFVNARKYGNSYFIAKQDIQKIKKLKEKNKCF